MIAVLITPLNIHKSIYYAKFILNLIIHFSCLKEKQTYSTSLRRKINETEHSVEIAAEKKKKKHLRCYKLIVVLINPKLHSKEENLLLGNNWNETN